MRNEIRFALGNADMVNAISGYHHNLFQIDKTSADFKVKIGNAQKNIDNITAKINGGDASKETADALAKAESAKKALADEKRAIVRGYAKKASECATHFCPDEILNAFVVSTEKGSVTATGSVTFTKTYKNGKVVETTYKTTCGLVNAIGKWLARIGINADTKSTKKLAEYIVLMAPVTKKQNIQTTGEYLKTVKGGQFVEAIMRAFYQYMVVRTGQFKVSEDGHLEPKKAEVKFESVSVDELF